MEHTSNLGNSEFKDILDYAEEKNRKIDNISIVLIENLYKNFDLKKEMPELSEVFRDILQSENITIFSLLSVIFFKDGFYSELPFKKRIEIKKIIENVFCLMHKKGRNYKKENYFLDNVWINKETEFEINEILSFFKDRIPFNTAKTRTFFLSFLKRKKSTIAFDAKGVPKEKALRDINLKNQMEYELLKLMDKYDRLKNF